MKGKTVAYELSPLASIHPERRLAYIDKLDVWLTEMIPHEEFCWLQKECRRRNIRVFYGPSLFNPAYWIRLNLFRPSWEAIAYLAKIPDLHFNGLEIALDQIFKNESQLRSARQIFDKHFVKLNHRKPSKYIGDKGKEIESHEDEVLISEKYEVTMYTTNRKGRNNVAMYHSKPSKITGQSCVHIEWRFKGVEALRRAQLSSLTELSRIDFQQFWKQRLVFFVVDFQRFGRRLWNMAKRSRRRLPWISYDRYEYNFDVRRAQLEFRLCERMQVFWDKYGKLLGGVRPYVKRVDVEYLLPENIR